MRLDAMNANNRELNWKLVKKGRSSRRSLRTRWNAATKSGNLATPERVGDFSGSDSEKFGECFLGQSSPSNVENVPIKKGHCLLSQHNKQHVCPRSHSRDFYGIELLAAAVASMNDKADSGDKESPVAEHLSLKTFGSSASASSSAICLKSSEPVKFPCNWTGEGVNNDSPGVARALAHASQSPCSNTDGGVSKKNANRMHWDLNIPMDAWDEPHDSKSKDSIDSENGKKESSDRVLSNAIGDISTKSFDVKLEASVSIFSSQVKTESESFGRIKDQILCCDSFKENETQARSICDAVDLSKDEHADLQFHDSKSSCIQDEMFDFAKKTQQGSDASQACDFPTIHGSNSTIIKEGGYNSPYEDGEVGGSYMHSWEENECVDYESDGRNEHETVMTDDHELAQSGASKVCHGPKHIEAGSSTRSDRQLNPKERSRRSSMEEENYFRARRRMPLTQEVRRRSKGNYLNRADDFEESTHRRDDTGASIWFPRSSRRDRNYPLDSGRSSSKHFLQRTHLGSRRRSRSPDYRSENRMEVPRFKHDLAAGYVEGYMPASRDRLSSQNKYRFYKDSPFPENYVKGRRSPIRAFNRTQRYGTVNLKSDYHRSVNRSGRSLEKDYNDRRLGNTSTRRIHGGLSAGYGEGYMPAPKDRLSSQNKYKFFKDSPFPENHVKRRRSPISEFKSAQRYDIGNLKSDEYHRSVNRSGRSSFAASGNGHNLKSDYNDRRLDDTGTRRIHRGLAGNNGGSRKQFERHNTDV